MNIEILLVKSLFWFFFISLVYKTQTDLNIERYESCLMTEKKLDSIYSKIKDLYKSDEGIFLLDLEKSQDLWLKYLEAQMIVKYPKNIIGRDRTFFSLCYNDYKMKLLNQRIEELIAWTEGLEDVTCSGSTGVFYDGKRHSNILFKRRRPRV